MDENPSNPQLDNAAQVNSDGDKEVLAPTEGPREHLIITALKFLQNPKVMSSPLYQKKAFLANKGLTTEEINIAVERSGVKENSDSTVQLSSQAPPPPPGYQGIQGSPHNGMVPMYAPIPPQSTWGRVRDLTMTSVIVVGVSYGVYRLFEMYLRPLLLGKTAQENRMERLESQVLEIQKSVTDSLSELNKTLAGIQMALQNQEPRYPVPNSEKGISDLKSDIASLKGLLLSKNQFPPAPSISPVLPAWQRAQPPSSVSETTASLPHKAPPTTTSPPPSKAQLEATSQPPVSSQINGIVQSEGEATGQVTLPAQNGATLEAPADTFSPPPPMAKDLTPSPLVSGQSANTSRVSAGDQDTSEAEEVD